MKHKSGDPAYYKNKEVKFSHVPGSKPDYLHVLVADPWSYIRNHIITLSSENPEAMPHELEREARKYLKLAKDFYDVSQKIDLPTKATLIYYGMMNLARVFTITEGVTSKVKAIHHGISCPAEKSKTVKIVKGEKSRTHMFKIFANCLGTKVDSEMEISLEEIFHIRTKDSLHNHF